MRANTVTAPSVPERIEDRQLRSAASSPGPGSSRQERRSNLGLSLGDAFNPFNLFDGALVPSEILRSPDLLPSEKLVFARLMQFAGGKGKAWPSTERIAEEVALSVPQARRCVRSLESKGFIRRIARSGRSNEFEFLWHAVYEQQPRSSVSAVPRSRVSDPLRSSVIAPLQSSVSGEGQSCVIAGGQSPKIGPGRSPMIGRRESIESSSSEEIHFEKNQRETAQEGRASRDLTDDDLAHRRKDLDDPEQEFLLRLQERHSDSVDRHAILQCVTGDLKSFSDIKPFLDFEQKQTTAPDKLKNPAGHYRRTVAKFYEARAKRRDWDIRQQMRALEARLGCSAKRPEESRSCSLGRCNGTGECWAESGLVSPCDCLIGQALSPKVLAAFEQMNASQQRVKGVSQ